MKKIVLKYGFLMLGGFIGLFLLMHLFGWSTNVNLRVLNAFIHLGAIYFAIQAYVNWKGQEAPMNYMPEIAVGMLSSFIGVIGFTIFMTLFLSFNPYFMEIIRDTAPAISEYLTPFTASLYIFVEGIVISLIGSYTIVRVIELMKAKSWS